MQKTKNINYYLDLPWTYNIETTHESGKLLFIVHVNELPGIATDAPTVEEAMQLIKEAMKSTFELYLKHGDEIPEPVNPDLEEDLINNVQNLLLEMKKGFALAGRQYHLEIDEKNYYIDLLFFHLQLKCFVVVELNARKFDPRDINRLNFYLSAVDDRIKSSEHNPTIGILLCKTKKNFTAEYALRNMLSPIGVAEYKAEIIKKLPNELKSNLPTIEEIERELQKQEALQGLDLAKNK